MSAPVLKASGHEDTTLVRRRSPAGAWGLLIVALAVGLCLRLTDLGREGLWMDEVFGASYNALGLVDTVVAVLRFDIHPPLYYLQLNLWSRALGNSDLALIGNSVLWSMAALAGLHAATRRLVDARTAMAATLLLAVSAAAVYFAQEVRMYAFMSALCVAAWYAGDRSARSGQRMGRWEWTFCALLAALSLSHGASFIPVSAAGVYWLLRLQGDWPARLKKAAVMMALVGAVLLPVLANSSFRSISHTSGFGLETIAHTIAGWLWGVAGIPQPGTWLAVAAVGAAVAMGVRRGGALRAVALAWVVYPVVAGATISALVRPIWLDRTFAFCAPFACLLLAALLVQLAFGRPVRAGPAGPALTGAIRWALVLALAALMGLGTLATMRAPRKMEYREAAAHLAAHARPGDIVYAPENITFWGMARYLAGPDWKDMLRVQDSVRPDKSDTWAGIYRKLGQDRLRWLGLQPESRHLKWPKGELVTGWSPLDRPEGAEPRLWVVGNPGLQLSELQICPGLHAIEARRFRGLVVSLCACDPIGQLKSGTNGHSAKLHVAYIDRKVAMAALHGKLDAD